MVRRYLLYVSELYSLGILRPLQKEILARGDQAAWFFDPGIDGRQWLAPDEVLFSRVAEVKNFRPHAVFVPGNIVPDFFPGLKVQVFHGLADDSMGKKGHYRIRGFFDLYCTRGEEETGLFQDLALKYGHFKVHQTGWPKLDPLFANRIQDLRPELGISKPIVLYASTFSPSLTSAPYLIDRIKRLAAKGIFHWMITLHPKMPTETVNKYRKLHGPNLSFYESHQQIWPLLKTADVMLCDTSSIMLEFMLLHKPVVTYQTANPTYPYLININNPDQIEGALQHALNHPPELMDAVHDYVHRLHPYRDGLSSERVLAASDRLMLTESSELKPKPLNLVRKMKIRNRLKYYRIY
ncbi:MAG: CDP-glycerol glycerophosphotransferase family protein [Desulfovermiculus sp.]|nr:CDP-glycerol glycerophosphotransferase family protein [Desulfovermiculus sp.]